MKISCLQEDLKRGLSIVARAVSSRSMLPITQNVLLSTEQSMLRISATDLNIAMTTWIGAHVEVEGSVAVPARLLSEFVNSLPELAIDIEKTSEPIGVNVKCARFEANISGTSGEDFPPIPTVEDGLAVKIEPGVLREAIGRVSFAAATEASRPVLTGVKTEIKGDEFKVAAADGFRLAVYSAKLAEAPAEDIDFLMPASVMNEIGRLLGSVETAVELTVTPSGNQALCRVGDVEIVTSLIAGNFPDYDTADSPELQDTGGAEFGRFSARDADRRCIRPRRQPRHTPANGRRRGGCPWMPDGVGARRGSWGQPGAARRSGPRETTPG